MGVPQRRERVFFIALRKDLAKAFLKQMNLFDILPEIKLEFNEPKILFNEIYEENGIGEQRIPPSYSSMWDQKMMYENSMNETTKRIEGVEKFFSVKYISKHKVLNTILGCEKNILHDVKRTLSKLELCNGGSYPLDYEFINNKPSYLIGMSIPPVMVAQIASEIFVQWLSKLDCA